MTSTHDDGADVDVGGGTVSAWATCADAELLGGIKRREQGAFGAIYERYGRHAIHVAQEVCDVVLADQAVQEVFLQLWLAPSSYDPGSGSLRAFLVAGAHERALRHRRAADRVDATTRIGELRDHLPAAASDAIALTLFGHFTYREAAEALGQTAAETSAHIRTGLQQFRALLADERSGQLSSAPEVVFAARALDHVSDGIIVVDETWNITYANTQAVRLTFRSLDELVGQNLWEVWPELSAHAFGALHRKAIRSGHAQHLEAYYEPLQGWFDVRSTPIEGGLALTFQNSDGRREAADIQTALVARLEHALTYQGQTQTVVTAFAEALSAEDVAATVVQQANAILGTSRAGVALLNEAGVTLRLVQPAGSLQPAANMEGLFRVNEPSALTDSVRLRQAMYHSSVAELLSTYPSSAGDIAKKGGHAFVNTPLVGGRGVIGVLSMTWAAERTFSEQDRTWVRVLAAECAQAIERTQLIGRQRNVAETLQQAMLPTDLPGLPGLEVAACYLPAATDLTVGGDWYDAFALPDGRLVVAVGDVSGHGVQAAAVMGQVRNALRAYVVEGHDPASALTRLDELVDHAGHSLFATVVVAVYEPATGELLWSTAGHPPLVVRAGSHVALLEGHLGAPLGVLGAGGHHNNRTTLDVGDVVVAYTDGLVERRHEALTDGFARLLAAVETAGGDAFGYHWCQDLVDVVLGDHAREDDICVLVLQRT